MIGTAGDADWFAFTLTTYSDVSFETFDVQGLALRLDRYVRSSGRFKPDCTTALAPSATRWKSKLLASRWHCSRPSDLAPGTYFVKVNAYGSTDTFAYTLEASVVASCGDGVVEGSEQCDGSANCGTDCVIIPTCGDGVISAGEVCDDSNANNGDGCSSTCAIEPGYSCSGTPSVCVALPYVESAISNQSCADMTGATAIPGVTSDTSNSAFLPAPFAFQYFGVSAPYFSVNSDGYLQAYTTSSGSPTGSNYANASIPSTSSPNGVIAPFWDDLDSGTSSSSVLYLVDGVAGSQRATFQWTNWTAYNVSGTGLTFQVQLYEGSNVIEFHYCTLASTTSTGAARVTGGSATVGIESINGQKGIQHSYNTASSISTATGIRFTPN
ncbi:MAG: myxococcus cysteine-rich repeat containing protein [Polyangiaceae bacterium]